MFYLCRNQVVGFTSKVFQKYLWKSDIRSKDAGRCPSSLLKISRFHSCILNIFSSKNQLPSFSVSGTLLENGLKFRQRSMMLFFCKNN